MSHPHTVIEPSAGLTVLVGPNNCGKSAVVRALQILCHNPPGSSYVLRHGEKRCDVIVETDTGDTVQWTRKKAGAVSYQVNGQVFDRLRGRVPEEVHQVLRMPLVKSDSDPFDIHFGEQSSPVFLLGDRGRAAAQFFASSSDAIHLVEMQSLHKSKVTIAKRDLTRFAAQQESLQAQQLALTPLKTLDEQLVACEKLQKQVEAESVRIEQLHILIEAIKDSTANEKKLQQQVVALREIEPPPVMQDPAPLALTIGNICRSQDAFRLSSAQATELASLESPPVFQELDQLAKLVTSMIRSQQQCQLSQAKAQAVFDLVPLPQTEDDSALFDLITRLNNRWLEHRRLNALTESLQSLSPAPTLENLDTMSDWIDRLKSADRQLGKKTDALSQLEEQGASIAAAVDACVQEHPSCPTCGGPLTKSHILGEGDADVS